jgi:hypothetical protein
MFMLIHAAIEKTFAHTVAAFVSITPNISRLTDTNISALQHASPFRHIIGDTASYAVSNVLPLTYFHYYFPAITTLRDIEAQHYADAPEPPRRHVVAMI